MRNKLFSVVVRVENLEACRSFYRDIIGLGNPDMDSNFWVEFRISDNVSFCLEKVNFTDSELSDNRHVFWTFETDNLAQFTDRMAGYGYMPDPYDGDLLGYQMKIFKDPEGNPFYVSEKKSISDL